MNYFIFGVILLHLIAGFGWLFYKLEIQKGKSKDDEKSDTDVTNHSK
jgi:hypothetical protein